MLSYSIVVPVFNSGISLQELYHRLTRTIRLCSPKYEIIFVDDNSKDSSWTTLCDLKRKDKHLQIIRLMKNYGQHNALLCGLSLSQGRYSILLDDDMQNPPEEIPKLIKQIKKYDCDAVTGQPIIKNHNILRNLGSYLIDSLFRIILNKPPGVYMGSFMIIKKDVVNRLTSYTSPNPLLGAILLSVTSNIQTIPVLHDKRKFGKSNYSMPYLISLSMNLIINYSTIPLQCMSLLGFITAGIGVGGFLYIIYGTMHRHFGVTGWPSLISSIFLFSGLILFSFGIIGEYLIRILRECQQRKQYQIREKK